MPRKTQRISIVSTATRCQFLQATVAAGAVVCAAPVLLRGRARELTDEGRTFQEILSMR